MLCMVEGKIYVFCFHFEMTTSVNTNMDCKVCLISGGTEYCPFETFKAECPQDEIIMITEALYGRMRKGRCVQDTQGKNT